MQLYRDRLELIRLADRAGFKGFHLAEHHGTDLCMAPNQEVFLAAASQITESIRLGPMVKLLPLHHPVRVVEDLCILDNLTNGRLEFGVGRGVAPVEHYWYGGRWDEANDRFEDALGILVRALRSGEISAEGSKYYDFRTMPMSTRPVQEHIRFWYPGSPATAGKFGMDLMWPGPIQPEAYDLYAQSWEKHRGGALRLEAPGAEPRVGCVLLVSLAESEREALDAAERAVKGLMRRTHAVHQWDAEILGEAGADAALEPLRKISKNIDVAVRAGAGTPNQIQDRLGPLVESRLSDYFVLQIPTGDMTFGEAQRTLELFASEVKPALEAA